MTEVENYRAPTSNVSQLLWKLPRDKTLYEITGGTEVYTQVKDCRAAALEKIKAVENG